MRKNIITKASNYRGNWESKVIILENNHKFIYTTKNMYFLDLISYFGGAFLPQHPDDSRPNQQ